MSILKTAPKHRLISGIFAVSFFLTVYASVWAYVALHSSSQQLILHFSEYSGITKTGGVAELTLFGVSGCILVAVNFFLALLLEEREHFLGRLLTGATLFTAVLIFIAVSAIISVN
ncbi:MAG: Uncharacterized protein LiPW15_62 [Parcubacteria group bacterium LiPW_15]|nr:MAG: Uncharacterized protein LiPW15_62 [Parcubacteria group bacterium LiPW_15]